MNAKTILFPTDFSTFSEAALIQATSLARDSGAKLLILHIEEPPKAYIGGMYAGYLEPTRMEIVEMLEQIKPDTVEYEHSLVGGDPATEIVRVAQERGADLIVMGTHGRTGLQRMLTGSVAEEVVRRATCPVLSFKEPASIPAQTD